MGTPPENVETTVTPAAAPATPAGKQSVTPQQLAIVGGVVLVILLGLVYFFFLRGGDEEEVPPPPTAEGIPAPEETEPPEDETADDDGDDDEVETFDVFAPRDPFEPLISAAGDGGGGTGDTAGDGDGTVDGDGDGDGDVTVDGGTDEPQPDGDTIGNHRVKVIDVYGRGRAQIQVDGTVYTVDEGEGFAGNFRLVSTSGACATILFGDDEFTLCEGEEILK